MQRRHGLGRGLGALLGEPTPASDGLRRLAIELVDPNPQQPRRTFDHEALVELEQSIRELGVLVPILVRSNGERYELIAGERRLRAAKAAGLTTIPALVRDVDDRESLEVAIVENLQRENLDPIEEAMGFAHLLKEYRFTQEHLATRLGRSRPAIANALRLLDLPDSVKARLQKGELTAGHARALLALPPELRATFADRVVQQGLSVREVERLARRERLAADMRQHAEDTVAHPTFDADREVVLDRLRQSLGAAVRIHGEQHGRIEILFATFEELERLVELLTQVTHDVLLAR